MGLGFLVPAFFAGLLAIAVPIVLHLRHRDKDRPFRFPSLMFLEQLPIRTAQRRRVTDWPLLLLRALVLALLALAFARPVFTRQALTGADNRSRAVVILLDRSASMGYGNVWRTAVDSARQVIAGLGAKDRVGVVFFDDASEVAQRLSDDKGAATAVLATAKPMSRGTRFAPALRTARQMLLDAPFAAAEIVVISDLQRAGAAGVAGIDLPSGVTLRAEPVGAPSHGNSALRAIDARRVSETTAGGTRSMLAVKARVTSRELAQPRTVTATLIINGRDAGTQSTTLANGETVVTFAPVAVPESDVVGRVQLSLDSLAADDTFHFVVPRDDAVNVALVLPDDARADETLYAERALTIGRSPEIRIARVRASAVDAALLRTSAVVVLWDVLPSETARKALSAFAGRGNGVAIVTGRRLAAARSASGAGRDTAPTGVIGSASTTTVAPTDALLPARITGLADRLSDRGGTLTNVRFEHPLFAPFRDAQDALLSARFLRYPRLEAAAGTDVLARFDDGLPAIVEQRVGAGRVIALATALDASSSDFPLQPAFLPFLRQLVLHASGRDATPLWRTTADNWSLPDGVTDAVVRAPDDALVRPQADSAGAAIALTDAGEYMLFSGAVSGAPRAVVAVNVPASEADLTPIDPKELLLGVRTGATDASTAAEAPTPDALERRQSAWRVLLVLVALALVGETIMATRGWRAVARRYPTAAPDRSKS